MQDNDAFFSAGGIVGLALGPILLFVGLDWTGPTTIVCERPAACTQPCPPDCTIFEHTASFYEKERDVGVLQRAEAVTEFSLFGKETEDYHANIRLTTERGDDWLLFWWTGVASKDAGHHVLAADLNRYVQSGSPDTFKASVEGEGTGWLLAFGGGLVLFMGIGSTIKLIMEQRRRPF